MADPPRAAPLPLAARLALTARIWWWFVLVRLRVRRHPLPEVVAWLGRAARPNAGRVPPHRLGRYVVRRLRIGPYQPTCLINALVLYRLLREQGDSAELVIGLPARAIDHSAHAWVELDGLDVGPPPGRADHVEMARYA